MGKEQIHILGARLDNLKRSGVVEWLESALENPPRQKFVVTLNPEIILKAHRKKEYKKILNSSDLNVCDGFGMKLAAFLRGEKIRHRWAGADISRYLLEKSEKLKLRVLVVAAEDSLSVPHEIERVVRKKYPGLEIEARYFENDDFFEGAAAGSADVVFVNFGAPRQEEFIFRHRTKFPEAKILIGVGGTFDFLTGKMKRAPGLWRKAGFEWLWRLIQEPKRIKRILDAVVIFPILAVFALNSKD